MKAKFNIIDALVILLIIAVGAFGYRFLNGRSGAGADSAKNVKIQYNIELAEKEGYMLGLINEGDKVLIGEKEKIPATVVGTQVRPAQKIEFDGVSGQYINADIPERYDIVVMLESEGTESENSVSVQGTAIRVGTATTLKGRDYAGYGFVTEAHTEE